MSRTRQLFALTEMAMDFGGEPDFIPPDKRQRIERGGHPYSENPAFPREAPANKRRANVRSYADLVASDVYPEIVRRLARYTGVRPRRPQDMFQLIQIMMGAVQQAMQIQRGNEEALEQAAVNTVLGLPEFESARTAVEQGELRIIAKLVTEVNLQGAEMEPEPENMQQAELEIAQVAQELDAEKHKRRFINMMIQGNAMSKNYAYHLMADQLNQIDPRLLNLYGAMMAGGEFMYWVTPDEQMGAAMGGGGGGAAGGSVRLRRGEDGVPEIHAEALVVPVLIQEIVKGLMEYLSHSDEDDPDTQRHVFNQTDTLQNEPWDIMLGPGVWKHLTQMIPDDKQRLMPHIYDALVRLPPEQFSRTVQSILQGTPEGQRYMQDLIRRIEGEMAESQAGGLIDRLLE